MRTIWHDSHAPFYRMPAGSLPAGSDAILRLTAPGAKEALVRLWLGDREKRIPMKRYSENEFEVAIALPVRPDLVWYYFIARYENGETLYYGNSRNKGGVGEIAFSEPPSFQITLYDPASVSPAWMRNAVMYQIFPDRYCATQDKSGRFPGRVIHSDWYETPSAALTESGQDGEANDFFGGDIKGITGKLDQIASMGISVLYLNPVFESVSNHRYNTGDYMKIDPMLGTADDFEELCREAGKRGIRVIWDAVFSHTGSDSLYFNREGHYPSVGAWQSPDSPYASWYRFRSYPDDYEAWWGILTLPCVNENDPSFRKFITGEGGVIDTWMEKGASGLRLDVADELPMDFIRCIRRKLRDRDPECAVIGEVWEDPTRKVAYDELRCYAAGDTLDASMNYPLREMVLNFLLGRADADEFAEEYASMRENQPPAFFYSQMNLLGSHDKARVISILADEGNMEPERRFRYPYEHTAEGLRRGKRRFIAAWQLLCALPGMPCLYYGDEAGNTGMNDPYCRGTYPWGREDAALSAAIRGITLDRKNRNCLRNGKVEVRAIGKDVLLVLRAIQGGQDAFGNAAEDDACALLVNRSAEEKTVFGRRVPPESAVFLTDERREA